MFISRHSFKDFNTELFFFFFGGGGGLLPVMQLGVYCDRLLRSQVFTRRAHFIIEQTIHQSSYSNKELLQAL